MRLSLVSPLTFLILSTSLIAIPVAANRPTRADGKPIADSPYERMAQGDAYAVDHLTHSPAAYRPEANSRLIFAVAFDKEDKAIWAFKNGATATEAITLCMSSKKHFEESYFVGICEKVEARFKSLMQHETNYKNAVRLVTVGLGIAAVATVTGIFFTGKWVVKKLKAA